MFENKTITREEKKFIRETDMLIQEKMIDEFVSLGEDFENWKKRWKEQYVSLLEIED